MPSPEFDLGPGFRSIYSDLVNMPDPMYLDLTVRIFNYDDVTLYIRVDGYKTGWTFTSNDLGALASGANMYRYLENLGNRAKPAVETTETITVRLRAYTDAAYSDLKWTFERVITLVFIKSDDGSWTQDELDNFDDGTVQGWAQAIETGAGPQPLAVATDYVLSVPYSLYFHLWVGGAVSTEEERQRIYKQFTTPNRNNVFAIFDLRLALSSGIYTKYLEFRNQGVATLVFLGRPYDTASATYVPVNKWMRIVIPLPKNTTLTVAVAVDAHGLTAYTRHEYMWMDDFRIISKD